MAWSQSVQGDQSDVPGVRWSLSLCRRRRASPDTMTRITVREIWEKQCGPRLTIGIVQAQSWTCSRRGRQQSRSLTNMIDLY